MRDGTKGTEEKKNGKLFFERHWARPSVVVIVSFVFFLVFFWFRCSFSVRSLSFRWTEFRMDRAIGASHWVAVYCFARNRNGWREKYCQVCVRLRSSVESPSPGVIVSGAFIDSPTFNRFGRQWIPFFFRKKDRNRSKRCRNDDLWLRLRAFVESFKSSRSLWSFGNVSIFVFGAFHCFSSNSRWTELRKQQRPVGTVPGIQRKESSDKSNFSNETFIAFCEE